jgi:hypothetical protein
MFHDTHYAVLSGNMNATLQVDHRVWECRILLTASARSLAAGAVYWVSGVSTFRDCCCHR